MASTSLNVVGGVEHNSVTGEWQDTSGRKASCEVSFDQDAKVLRVQVETEVSGRLITAKTEINLAGRDTFEVLLLTNGSVSPELRNVDSILHDDLRRVGRSVLKRLLEEVLSPCGIQVALDERVLC